MIKSDIETHSDGMGSRKKGRLMLANCGKKDAAMATISESSVQSPRRQQVDRVPVSVIVPVKNEAENLKRCLPALEWADEVIVVDSQSDDATAFVAEEHGASVSQFHFNGTYPKKKNWASTRSPFAMIGC